MLSSTKPVPQRNLPTLATLLFALLPVGLAGCRRNLFPQYPANYREFAYISNGADGTVTVLDLVYLRRDRTLTVGKQPTGLAVNPVRDEVYAVNSGSESVSVIDASTNQVIHTIGVHAKPYFIAVSPDGRRAYVPNSGANTVSVLDLDRRREIATEATGEAPGVAVVSQDNHTLVITNRVSGSVSVYTIDPQATAHPLHFRAAFSGCAGATDAVLLPDDSKAFVACSGSHKLMVVGLEPEPGTWRAKQDPTAADHLLTFLDVGQTPTHLSLKPDTGEVFATNFGSGSISEISTGTNEVSGTYSIGANPSSSIVSRDDSSLWVTTFGADAATRYSIDDGRVNASVRTGSHPDALAFNSDESLLLVVDAGSSDVTLIRPATTPAPMLMTLLPCGREPNAIVVKSSRAK